MGHYLKEELYKLIKSDENIFDFIQKGSLDGIWYWDLENPENEWMNDRFWETLGYDPERMPHLASAWQNIINKDDLEIAIDNFNKHVADPNRPYDQEVRYKHKNGTTVWIRCRGIAIRDAKGKPTRMLGAHQDITELKLAKEKLQLEKENAIRNEEKYKAMYDNAPLAYQSLDKDGKIIEINSRWLKILQYSENEVIGKWFGDFLHPDYVLHFRENFQKFKKQGSISNAQFKMLKKNGETIYVSFEGCIGYDDNNNFKQTYCTFKDITQQKLVEKKFQYAMEATNDGIWDWNLQTDEVYYSPAWYKILGYKPNTFEQNSSTWRKLVYPPDMEAVLESNKRCINNLSQKIDIEFRMIAKDGSLVWILGRGKAIERDKNGIALRIIGTHIDITERKQAEQLIVESKNQYRLLVESSPNIILTHTLDGKITYINKNGADFLNRNQESLIGKKLSTFLSSSNQNEFTKNIELLLSNREELFKTEQTIEIDGEKRVTELNAVPITKDNEIKEILLQATDITERKDAEHELNKTTERLQLSLITNQATVFEDNLEDGSMYCTPELFQLFGYKKDEIPTTIEEYTKLVHPDDISSLTKSLNNHIDGKIDEYYAEYRIKDKKGDWQWIDGKGKIVAYTENGNPKTLIGISRDINEKKLAEKRLQEKNDQFETIIKGANLGWWDWDIPSGDEIYNEILTENLGYKLSEIKPHIDWWEGRIHPEDIGQVSIDLEEHFKCKTDFYRNKHRLLTKTGEWKWFLDYGKVVERDSDNNPIRMIGTLRDIDFEERAKEKINANLQQIRAINANIPNIIWKSDIDKDGKFTNSYISEAVNEFLALPESEIKNSWDKYFSYVLPEYLPLIDQIFKDAIKNPNNLLSFDYRVKKADGKIAWFSSTGRVVDENKKITVYGSTIDITERKEAEATIKDSETRFKALHNASFGGITIHDKGVILECNNGLSEISGYSMDELIGMDGLLLIAEESRELVMENILEGYEETYEAVGIRKNGEKYPLRLEARKIPYKNKNVRVVEFRDITEQKKADKKLKESEEILRNIFDNSTSVLYSHDTENIVNYVSPQIIDVLGYTQDEVKTNWEKLLSDNPINEIGYKSTLKAIKTGKKQPPYELEFIHKNGKKVLIEAREAPVIKDGKTVSIVGIFNDITKRKRNEIELIKAKKRAEESEHKIRSMFLNTQIGIIFCNTNGEIIEINPVILDILGSPSIEATKKINVLTFQPLIDVGFSKDVTDCITNRKIISKDVLYNTKWGKAVYMKYYVIPVIVNGKVVGVWANLNNLTDIYTIQNQLKSAKEKAEESDRLKSAFLANMSHEIRTPMNGILGFTELLKEPNLSGEEKEQYIEIIRKSGDRMLDTVNDIIDISKIDAGQMEIFNTEIDINEVIKNQFEFFGKEAMSKGLELSLTNRMPQKVTLISDKVKLDSIISNLIKNAIKYTDDGSIEIHCRKKGSELEFRIIDTGIGITKNRIERIFNRFEQADIEDTHAREGSGLGLSITKAYIEMMGGKIDAESEAGKGSEFFFTLPWIEKQEESIEKESQEEENTIQKKQLNVLIAEDDDISFEHLRIILNKITKNIVRVKNGRDAIEFMKRENKIELILMDIKLPIVDGYKATKEIRKFNKKVVILAQTAYALEGDKEKAIECGCNDYISKPINNKIILELVTKYSN